MTVSNKNLPVVIFGWLAMMSAVAVPVNVIYKDAPQAEVRSTNSKCSLDNHLHWNANHLVILHSSAVPSSGSQRTVSHSYHDPLSCAGSARRSGATSGTFGNKTVPGKKS